MKSVMNIYEPIENMFGMYGTIRLCHTDSNMKSVMNIYEPIENMFVV